MHRGFVKPLLVCLALALALLAPLRARAAMLPACENRELLTPAPLPTPSLLFVDAPSEVLVRWTPELPADPSCGASGDELTGDAKSAPICDPRGASAIAPPRVLPVSDARIEATPSCELELSSPMIGPAPRDASTIHAAVMLAEHATLAGIDLVPPASSELSPAYPPVRGEAHTGIERSVYHPPR
jgi:hypothetical protein